ncbi:hypothetical protein F4814DRAFT_126421 [Daldinia grandis]|nr:hypothetical protein F4814DRAFT_126421 [Daldinia grandis]
MAWYRTRKKALDLVRQRKALAARVSFTYMSMISSRIRKLEQQNTTRGASVNSSLAKLETIIYDQKAEIYRLEDLLRRSMHQNKLIQAVNKSPTSPRSKKSPKSPKSPKYPIARPEITRGRLEF